MKQKKEKEQKERDFEKLVQEHRQTIYSVCYLFANDRQEADDLAQEVLIHLWQGFENFEGRSSAKTWVYRVALNTCVTLDKRQRRRPDCMPLEVDIDFFADEDAYPAANRLHNRIAKLHPFDRALILLWLEDLPYDEIAAILGISVDNVSVRLVRIREKLKSFND
ncbi:MAG: sigma-70 family RNA polymerase sigma factor [Bacteroidales bacterium]|nr:sigma-70 family RNA polymerase sigma factor [Bacteroidales bacterium]